MKRDQAVLRVSGEGGAVNSESTDGMANNMMNAGSDDAGTAEDIERRSRVYTALSSLAKLFYLEAEYSAGIPLEITIFVAHNEPSGSSYYQMVTNRTDLHGLMKSIEQTIEAHEARYRVYRQ